jgi:cytochrome P450
VIDRSLRAGPVFTYSIGNMVFLHASRPDVVRDLGLCVSPDLGKSSYMKVTHRPLFGDGILKSSGEAWAHQRRLIAPEFFPDKVRAMVGLMVGSATALVESWERRGRVAASGGGGGGGGGGNGSNGGRGGGLELELRVDDDIRAYSADVISRACFGSSYVKGKEIFAVIRELQKTVSKPNLLAEMTGLSSLPTRSNRAAWRLNRQVRALVLDVVRGSGDDDGDNLLNAMLRSSAAASGGGGGVAAEDFIVDNCKNIYFAGYETTAVTAAWCLMLLALHPEWQAQVRDEARQACAAAAAAPDFTSLQRMKKVGSSSVGFIHSFIHSSMNARTDTHV